MFKRPYSKLLLLFVVILALLLLVGSHSCSALEMAQSSAGKETAAAPRILLATQGSAYKNALVEGVITAATNRQMEVLVINVAALSKVNLDDWQALVIVHAWESWEPQVDGRLFTQDNRILDKIIMVTTSGEGDLRSKGVDAITSASNMSEVPAHVGEIMRRIDLLLTQPTATR
ncbi:MAG: hypothetical protein ACJA13_000820 [Paraglaciecola sp.]|jgi:hypothetical protein